MQNIGSLKENMYFALVHSGWFGWVNWVVYLDSGQKHFYFPSFCEQLFDFYRTTFLIIFC